MSMWDDEEEAIEEEELDEKAAQALVRRFRPQYETIKLQNRIKELELQIEIRNRTINGLEQDLQKERAMPYRGTNVAALVETIEALERQLQERGK